MKILLLCDRKSAGGDMPNVIQDILTQAGHEVQAITLNHRELKPCVGCFGWLVQNAGGMRYKK